jgi:putative transposase
LKLLREKNPVGDIVLMLDNLPSHKAHIFKNKAKELNIVLLNIPTYSPQVQPIEKIWYTNKRDVSSYKIKNIKNIKNIERISKEETKRILEEEMTKSFYNDVQSKNKWDTVRENYIKPLIKLLNPEHNFNWEVQRVNQT